MASEVQNRYGSRVLTPTEMRVICLVAAGEKNHEVASGIGATEHVAKNMLPTIFDTSASGTARNWRCGMSVMLANLKQTAVAVIIFVATHIWKS